MKMSWIVAGIIALLAVAWVGSGYLLPAGSADNGRETVTSRINDRADNGALAVRVRDFAAEPMVDRLIVSGRTRAQRQVEVRSELAGRVADIAFRRGDSVEEGAVIVRLAEDERASRLADAQATVSQRESDYERTRTLNQQGHRPDSAVTEARAALESARAQLTEARLNMARLDIPAPFGGILDERHVEMGDVIDRGEPVAILVDLDPLRVRAQVAERNLGQVRRGMTATVRFVGGGDVEGEITYVGASADQETRTFPIEVEVSNPDGRYIDQVTAEVRIPLDEREAHLVPASLLGLSDEGQIGIKSVDDDGRVVFNEIRIIADGDGGVWVTGLPDRVTLITVGHEFVREGQTVRPVTEDEIARRSAQP